MNKTGRKGSSNRGRGRGRLPPGMRPVDEQTRIDIASTLASFRASDAQEYQFPPGLSNHDRAIVHSECKKYGLKSKSYGKGESRAVTVFKSNGNSKNDADVFDLPLGGKSEHLLNSYFSKFPSKSYEQVEDSKITSSTLKDSQYTQIPSSDLDYKDSVREVGDDLSVQQELRKENGSGDRETISNFKRKRYNAHAAFFDAEEIKRRRNMWEKRMCEAQMASLVELRQSLPIAHHREEIIAAIQNHQVLLIAGETGCGKTTQVPQYILEDCWKRNIGCRVICTQPRRISAISVAERVASERGEKQAGETVGYTIRLDSVGGASSSILFCTNGVLLRMLTGSKRNRSFTDYSNVLETTTHIVVDEIHERDRFADFLLILVRDILPAKPELRVVLMSATLHIDLFCHYFGDCPVIQVPGFTHPIQDFYLEDVLKLTGYQDIAVKELTENSGKNAAEMLEISVGDIKTNKSTNLIDFNDASGKLSARDRKKVEDSIERAFRVGTDEDFEMLLEVTGAATCDDASSETVAINVQHTSTGATALIAACFRARFDIVSILLSNGADPSLRANNGMSARDFALQAGSDELIELLDDFEQQKAASEELASTALALSHYQAMTDADEVDLDLIEILLRYICCEGQFKCNQSHGTGAGKILGAILIFLPGWDEIVRLKDQLENSRIFSNYQKYSILPLHSMVAPAEQRKVFLRPPVGKRKIVLATNIAETSITIDDVVCVIDTGKLKEKSYDPFTGVSTLQGAWISKASEKQRRGRAGRCQAGVAFHLYSRQRSESFAEFQLPELKRSPLDEICLQVKLLDGSEGESPLQISEVFDVASEKKGRIAKFLQKAVDPPLPQAIERAVELLIDIGALDDDENMTILGRHLAFLPIPPALGKMLLYGVMFNCLDPVLTVACCMSYRDPWILPASAAARRDASMVRSRLSSKAGGASDHLATVLAFNGWKAAQVKNLGKQYCSHHFLSPATMNMIDGMRGQLLEELKGRGFIASLQQSSLEAHRADLVRGVLACGFYPQIGRLLTVPKQDPKVRTAILTRNGEKVRIHPASVNAKLRMEEKTKTEVEEAVDTNTVALLFYDEITRGEASLYLKSSTAIHPHPAILVSAHLAPETENQLLDAIDSRLKEQDTRTSKPASIRNDLSEDDLRSTGVMNDAMEGMKIHDMNSTHGLTGNSDDISRISASHPNVLCVDRWLRFRVPHWHISHLISLNIRLNKAFAYIVRNPGSKLPNYLSKAIKVVIDLFINESESGDGNETELTLSFKGPSGERTKLNPSRSRGKGRHTFRYQHLNLKNQTQQGLNGGGNVYAHDTGSGAARVAETKQAKNPRRTERSHGIKRHYSDLPLKNSGDSSQNVARVSGRKLGRGKRSAEQGLWVRGVDSKSKP